jgi:hypothetical protein
MTVVQDLLQQLETDPTAVDELLSNERIAEKVGSRMISELAKFMQSHSFEEIQDLAESGELDKHLPLVPSSPSVKLGDFDKTETFDRRRFDSEAFDRYLGSLGG